MAIRPWSFKQCAWIILILILIGSLRDSLAINCSDIEFRDIDSLSEKVQAESPRFSKVNPEPRITGGQNHPYTSIPFMVAICREYNEEKEEDRCGHSGGIGNICAGVIIHESFILTAASCIENFNISGMRVLAGQYILPWYQSKHGVGEIRSVSYKVVHDNFQREEYRINNDLALLKVDREIKDSGDGYNKIGKISLASGTLTMTRKGMIYGWGCTYFSKNECQYFNAEKVREAAVPIWSDDECQKMLSKLKNPITINDFHICAAGTEETGFCYGDAGSPLVYDVVHESTEEEVLVGIASFLAAPSCGCDGIPTVYTEVSHYRAWIQRVLSGEFDISKASIRNINQWIVLHAIAFLLINFQ